MHLEIYSISTYTRILLRDTESGRTDCLVTEIGEYRLGELPACVTRPPAFFHSFAAEQFFHLPSGFLCRLDKVRVSLLLL